MAIWQYNLLVIPKESIHNDYQCIFKNNKTKYLPETKAFWKNRRLDILNIASQIDKLVTRANWSDETHLAWEDNDENEGDNDCSIFLDDSDQITSFHFRVDLRKEDNILNFLKGMLSICKANNLCLIDLKGKLMDPEFEIIFENLKDSNAFSFLNDPIKFLESLKN